MKWTQALAYFKKKLKSDTVSNGFYLENFVKNALIGKEIL